MNLLSLQVALAGVLGQTEPMAPWEGVQKAFRNNLPQAAGELSPYQLAFRFVVGLVAVVALLYVVARYSQSRRSGPKHQPPTRFFSTVLRELGIGLLDRALMRRIARHSGLPQPAVILFSTDLLERYSREWIETISLPPLRSFAAARIEAIESRAFTDEPAR